jgi:hypothetical protein
MLGVTYPVMQHTPLDQNPPLTAVKTVVNCEWHGKVSGFGIPKKLVRLIKMCLTETYSRVRVGKNLSEMFPIGNGLKQGDALSPLLINFAVEYAIKRV